MAKDTDMSGRAWRENRPAVRAHCARCIDRRNTRPHKPGTIEHPSLTPPNVPALMAGRERAILADESANTDHMAHPHVESRAYNPLDVADAFDLAEPGTPDGWDRDRQMQVAG